MPHHSEKALVIKFGGSSSTTMEGANPEYFLPFFASVREAVMQHYARLALVIGGGARIRALQAGIDDDRQKDAVAIQALRDHASQLGRLANMSGIGVAPEIPQNEGHARSLIARDASYAVTLGGLKVGQSTDTVAVTAAEIFRDQGYEAVILILSNVWRIFTADPKSNPLARPIRTASLDRLVEEGVLLNDPARFRSGMNVTIDPVAVNRLQQQNREVPLWFGHGLDHQNVVRYASSQLPSDGTSIVRTDRETAFYDET